MSPGSWLLERLPATLNSKYMHQCNHQIRPGRLHGRQRSRPHRRSSAAARIFRKNLFPSAREVAATEPGACACPARNLPSCPLAMGHERQVSSPTGAAACGTQCSTKRQISRPALPSEERCSEARQAPGLEGRKHAFATAHACSEFAASPSGPLPLQAHAPARTQHRDFAA